MRIFSWVQNKLHGGGQEKKRFNAGSSHHAQKEELDDWPHALLSIGTLGGNELMSKEEEQKLQPERADDPPRKDFDPSEDVSPDFTIEEVDKLRRELKELLSRKSRSAKSAGGSEIGEEDRGGNLPLNRFLNCPSSLEVDRMASAECERPEAANNGDLSPNTRIIINRVKDMLLGNRSAIRKKSISFLLKKLFVCGGGGFAPAPSLRDPIPESRMEKILREILTKKMSQQSPAPTSSKKRLENATGGEEENKNKSRSKWVKTDSEFIVLEI